MLWQEKFLIRERSYSRGGLLREYLWLILMLQKLSLLLGHPGAERPGMGHWAYEERGGIQWRSLI